MKRLVALGAALVLSLASCSQAQAQPSQAYHASGVVKAVNVEKGTVRIAHGPVASLDWPAMTMSFVAADPKMLDKLQPGTKVTFDFVQQGARYTITSIR